MSSTTSSQAGTAVITAYQPLGGVPNTTVDLPISAVLLALFAGAAIWHMTCFIRSRIVHPPKFIFSVLLFVLCMSRIAALSLRIVWSLNPLDTDLALAATILTSAGVLILYIVNLILARRIVRALHPASFGPSGAAKRADKAAARHLAKANPRGRFHDLLFRLLLMTIIAVLIMVVVCSVHSFFATNPTTLQQERTVLLFAGTYIVVLAILPAVAMAVVAVAAVRRNGWRDPHRRWLPAGATTTSPGDYHPASVGEGSFGFAMALLAFTSLLLSVGAGMRVGGNYAAVPRGQERWFLSKPALYCFTFAIELIVVWAYAVFRFDRRYSDLPSARHFAGGSSSSSSGPEVAAAHGGSRRSSAAKEAAA
ncbi:hypothetical protein VTJ49DRAFT_3273 [Mycothermus thermophilus]|uniref:Uncharacterized protein n=1 Tax=Humicola insolens TaxID=85995 RepID=A0ABR3V829_HUMIN